MAQKKQALTPYIAGNLSWQIPVADGTYTVYFPIANFDKDTEIILPPTPGVNLNSVLYYPNGIGLVLDIEFASNDTFVSLILKKGGYSNVDGSPTASNAINRIQLTDTVLVETASQDYILDHQDTYQQLVALAATIPTTALGTNRTYTTPILADDTARMPSATNDTMVIVQYTQTTTGASSATMEFSVDSNGDLSFAIIKSQSTTAVALSLMFIQEQCATFIVPAGANYKYASSATGAGANTAISIKELTL